MTTRLAWRGKQYCTEACAVSQESGMKSPNEWEFSVEEIIVRIKRNSKLRVYEIRLLEKGRFHLFDVVACHLWDDAVQRVPGALDKFVEGNLKNKL